MAVRHGRISFPFTLVKSPAPGSTVDQVAAPVGVHNGRC